MQRLFARVNGILRGKGTDGHGFSEAGDDTSLSGLIGTQTRIAPGTTVSEITKFGIGTLPEPSRSLQLLDQAHSDARELAAGFVLQGQQPTPNGDNGQAGLSPAAARASRKNSNKASVMTGETSSATHLPGHPNGRTDTRGGAMPLPPMLPHDLLETVGRENESLRHRCEEVVRKVEEAATLRHDLTTVFSHVDLILKDLERTKTALAQRNATLVAERDAAQEIKLRHRQLLGDHDQLRNENLSLQGERQKHFDSFTELEARAGTTQVQLAEKTRLLTEVSRRSEDERERLAQIEQDIQAARDELQRADDLIFSLQSDLSAARDHATLVEEDNKTLQVGLADARQQIARFARKENEVQAILTANTQRIDDLELMVNSERVEHGKTRVNLQGESSGRRSEVTSLQAKLDAMSSRAEASDRLLGEARSQMHGKVEELRKAERRVQELQVAAAPLDSKLAAFEQENRALRNSALDLEAQHIGLGEFNESLTKSLRTKEREAANWKQKVDSLSDRFQIEMIRYEEERERFQQTVARLGEQLEKERLDRAMAEGALEVARKQRSANSLASSQMASKRQADGSAVPAHGHDTVHNAGAHAAAESNLLHPGPNHSNTGKNETDFMQPRKIA